MVNGPGQLQPRVTTVGQIRRQREEQERRAREVQQQQRQLQEQQRQQTELRRFLNQKLEQIARDRAVVVARKDVILAKKSTAQSKEDRRELNIEINAFSAERRATDRLLKQSEQFVIEVGEARRFLSDVARSKRTSGRAEFEAIRTRERIKVRIKAGEFGQDIKTVRQLESAITKARAQEREALRRRLTPSQVSAITRIPPRTVKIQQRQVRESEQDITRRQLIQAIRRPGDVLVTPRPTLEVVSTVPRPSPVDQFLIGAGAIITPAVSPIRGIQQTFRRFKISQKLAVNLQKQEQRIEEFVLRRSQPGVLSQQEVNRQIGSNVTLLNQNIDSLTTESKKFESDVNTFNKEFGDKELSQRQFDLATRTRQDLLDKASVLEDTKARLTSQAAQIQRFEEVELGKRRAISLPSKVAVATFKLPSQLVFGVAAAGAALIQEPGAAGIAAIAGITALPGEIARAPVETGIEIIGGTLLASSAASAISRALGSVGRVRTRTRIKPRIRQSIDISDAVQVGELAGGLKRFRVRGRIVTEAINPRTKARLELITTDTLSDVIVARTKQGALRAAVESAAISVRKGSLRRFSVKEPKLTVKATASRARGEITFTPVEDAQRLIRGIGESRIRQEAVIRLRATQRGVTTRVTRPIARPTERALQQTLTRTLGPTQVTRVGRRGAVTLAGVQEPFISAFITDVSPVTRRVRGFTREVTFRGGELLGELPRVGPRVERIRPTVRRPSVEPTGIPERGFSVGKVFTPKELTFKLGEFESSVLGRRISPRPVIAKRRPRVNLFERLETEIRRQQRKPETPRQLSAELQQSLVSTGPAAAVAAEAQVRALASSISRQVGRQRVRVRDRVSPATRIGQRTAQAVVPALSVKQIQRVSQRQEALLLQVQRPSISQITAQTTKLAQVQRAIPALASIAAPTAPAPAPRITGAPTIRIPLAPRAPVVKVPLFPSISDQTESLFIPKGTKGFDVFGVSKATKPRLRRKIKLNVDPVTEQDALNLGAFAVDNSISARFNIRKTKGTPRPLRNLAAINYFNQNRDKFRRFKRRKGKKIALKNTFIERRGRRLDTIGETNQIKIARFKQRRQKPLGQFF